MRELAFSLVAILILVLVCVALVEGWFACRAWRIRRQYADSDFSSEAGLGDFGGVSEKWLRGQEQQQSRIEYHGPRIAWPIRTSAARRERQ